MSGNISQVEFFTSAALYEEYPLDFTNLDDSLRVEFYQGVIDAYCNDCGKERAFISQIKMPTYVTDSNDDTGIPLDDFAAMVPDLQSHACFAGFGLRRVGDYICTPRTKLLTFRCPASPSHNLVFAVRFTDEGLKKIGQYPSVADLKEYGVRRYRKLLGDEKYKELTKAIGLHAHGVGIGSLVYLRRIFERLIDNAHERAAQATDWDEDAFRRTDRMEDLIALLRHELPDLLVQNRQIYRILSAGIHTLSEDDCLQHFATVRNAIELILDAEIQARDKQRKEAEMTKSIHDLHEHLRTQSKSQ